MMSARTVHEQLQCDGEAVRIAWPSGPVSTLPYLWLRDNCNCQECRIAQTDEKKFIVCSVPADIEPASAELIGDKLHVAWPDGHVSIFDGGLLRAFGGLRQRVLHTWPAAYQPHRCGYHAFLEEDGTAADALEHLVDDGALIISDAPTESGTLEHLAPRLGPIREVLFDRIHDVAVDPNGYNVAHTPYALPPHNDFASYTWPPSVQALHMLANETAGGDSIIVDGWSLLSVLRQERPDDFEVLCRVSVPFREFDEKTETYAEEPIIRCDADGRISGLRFSNQLMQAIDPNHPDAASFYRAYHELCRRIVDSAGHVTFRLNGGEILIVDAHRVLHGRQAFEAGGRRHLQDAYYELDNVRNHLVVLQRKQEQKNA